MGNDAYLQGHKALMRKIDRLRGPIQRRIMRPAVTQALTPILKTAKALCPVRTGLLKRSLGKKVHKKGREIWGGVGPRKSFDDAAAEGEEKPGDIVYVVEHGTSKAAAHPFMRPALDRNREQALAILARKAKEGLAKEAKEKLQRALSG